VGAASKVVDRVEAAGHCVRLPNPDDRRSSLIDLTPTGTACLTRATAAFDEELRARFGALSPTELRNLATALSRIRSEPDGAS
jgi:DNA-binding MarR family transcriptional regulator